LAGTEHQEYFIVIKAIYNDAEKTTITSERPAGPDFSATQSAQT
jgi:hypothetical protein